MSLSVAVLVGEAKEWLPAIVEEAKKLTVGSGFDPEVLMGPITSKEGLDRIKRLIHSGVQDGATCLLDGRLIKASDENHRNGNFVGPTILYGSTTKGNSAYDHEIFGPVLFCTEVDTLNDAVQLVNRSKYGNGAVIFTESVIYNELLMSNIAIFSLSHDESSFLNFLEFVLSTIVLSILLITRNCIFCIHSLSSLLMKRKKTRKIKFQVNIVLT